MIAKTYSDGTPTAAPVSMRGVTILEAARRALAHKASMGTESLKSADARSGLEKILATLPDETAAVIRALVAAESTASFHEGRELARATEYRQIVEESGLTVEQVIEAQGPRGTAEQTKHDPDAM